LNEEVKKEDERYVKRGLFGGIVGMEEKKGEVKKEEPPKAEEKPKEEFAP